MTTDTDGDTVRDEKSMSRRSVLSGAGVVAGGWLVNKLTGGAVSVAKAQQSQEYRIEFAPDDITTWAIDDEVQGDGTVDLIIKHVPSDTTVRWDRSEGEFDFSEIQSFIVDSLSANAVDSQTVNAGSLVIGGTLYEEDGNSPINVTDQSSFTYSVGGSYREIIIIGDTQTAGFDQLQVNGDTSSNYEYITNADAQTTGANQWSIPYNNSHEHLSIAADRGTNIRFSASLRARSTGEVVSGRNANISGTIDQFTMSDSGGSNRDFTARVFGRDI